MIPAEDPAGEKRAPGTLIEPNTGHVCSCRQLTVRGTAGVCQSQAGEQHDGAQPGVRPSQALEQWGHFALTLSLLLLQ